LDNKYYSSKETLLRFAIEVGNVKLVRTLLGSRVNVNFCLDNIGNMPLHIALMNQNEHTEEIIELLYKWGADINKQNSKGDTPLHTALMNQNEHTEQIIDLLIKFGADIDKHNNDNSTPLIFALKSKKLSLIKKLVNCGAKFNKEVNGGVPILHLASQTSLEIFQFFLELVCNNEEPQTNEIVFSEDFSLPLEFATNEPSLDYSRAKELIINNKINEKDAEGNTCFHWAAQGNSTDIINYIEQTCGVSYPLTDRNNAGLTFLHTAAKYGALDVIKYYQQAYPYFLPTVYPSRDNKGNTLLHYAAHFNRKDVVRYFLEQGVDVNVVNEGNITPLFFAASKGYRDIVELLLKYNADVKILSWNSFSCLHQAIEFPEVFEMLLGRGADINAQEGKVGWTPLHFAVLRNKPNIVKVLLQHGVNIDIKDNKGQTPLHYATQMKNTDIIEMLLWPLRLDDN